MQRVHSITVSEEFAHTHSFYRDHTRVNIKYLSDNKWADPVIVGDEGKYVLHIRQHLELGLLIIGGVLAYFAVLIAIRRVFGPPPYLILGRKHTKALQTQPKAIDVEDVINKLPFETLTVPGNEAYAAWQRLRSEGRGYPVVLGTRNEAALFWGTPWTEKQMRDAEVADVLEKARHLQHPASLQALAQSDIDKAREIIERIYAKKQRSGFRAIFSLFSKGRRAKQNAAALGTLEEELEAGPPLGEWPATSTDAGERPLTRILDTGLSIARHSARLDQNGELIHEFKEHVVIALLPVAHSWEVFAYLLYGGWNGCPPPEHHVATLRSWSERYGAEVVGVASDALDIRVMSKPATREEALDLAREQYLYCNDIVDQGVGTLSDLAALLMQDDWWYFWWD